MQISAVPEINKRKESDLIVFPFWYQKKGPKAAASLGTFQATAKTPIEAKDFSGKSGEILLLYSKGAKEKRCLLLGLGKEEELDLESLRKAYALVAKECHKRKAAKINLVVPNVSELRGLTVDELLTGMSEGILLPNYQWKELGSKREEKTLIKHLSFIGVLPKMLGPATDAMKVAEGVYFARDLVNGSADRITPQYLAKTAQELATKFSGVKATVFGKNEIEKQKMGLLLAVSRGSAVDPAFITLSYKGAPRSKDHTVLVGKGVTYDTGGLNIKPTGSMETMRSDMAGSATVLGTLAAVASLGLKVNVTAVIAATENSVDGRSYKPGDVYTSHKGTTVEVGNTDAEGRLTLADALSYSVDHLKPTRIIDLATLTGSVVIALGEDVSGLFANQDTLANSLLEASKQTGESMWRLPLYAPYKELFKSDIADLKNIGGRAAGSITAALFLQEFVTSDIPWAHIDIAGTAFCNKERAYIPKNASGYGVRLLVDFLRKI
ncbi:MAG: putative cytosol aminopeptidase [Chlamydiae bacterium]|nr:putative cytosol aminopeptidase [Chlamydiota bacterium]